MELIRPSSRTKVVQNSLKFILSPSFIYNHNLSTIPTRRIHPSIKSSPNFSPNNKLRELKMNVTIVERFFTKYQNVHEIFHQPSKLSKQLGTCPARTCHEYRIKPLNGPLTITGFKGKNSTLTSQSFGHLTRLRYETRSFEREKERVDVSACPFEGCRLENVADGCQLTLAPG